MPNMRQDFNFAATFRHPLAQRGLVEMLPTAWIRAISNPAPSDETDLTPGGPELVGMDTLWQHLQDNGMRDPFILSAGRYSRDCRLEAGNHRINLFADHGIHYVPASVLVGDCAVFYKGNGKHSFRRDIILPEQAYKNAPYDERVYMAPSAVFADIAALKKAGRLPAPSV